MSMRVGMGTGTGAGTLERMGMSIDMRMEGKESRGTYDVALELGRKTREGGRRQRVTSHHSCKTRRPSETVASCRGPEPRGGRRRTGSGGVEKRQRSARSPTRIADTMWETGDTWAGREKNADKKVLVQ